MGRSHRKLRPERAEVLKKEYDAYLEADKKRKERNEYILLKMNDMRSLNYASHLQPQINPGDYKPKQYPSTLFASNQTCTSSEVNALRKYNCHEEVLREISKDFILIPKQHRYNSKGDSFNIYNADTDWRSKYKILDKLKQIEKDDAEVPVRDESVNVDEKTNLGVASVHLENKIETKESRSDTHEYKQEQATEIIYGIPVDSGDKRELAKLYAIHNVLLTPALDSGEVIQTDGVFSIKPKEEIKTANSEQSQQQNTISQSAIRSKTDPTITENVVLNTNENPTDNLYEYDDMEPIEIINAADFTPHDHVELKDGININPVYESLELTEPASQHNVDTVIEPNQCAQDPEAETELEAESRMFYQEQPNEQIISDSQDNAQNEQENQQNDYHVYYEQQLAESTNVGEFDETEQKYDQSYKQQYESSEAYAQQPTEYMQVDNSANDHSQSQYYAVDDQQESYAELQQMYGEQQQPYVDQEESYIEPQLSYTGHPETYAEQPHVTDSQQSSTYAQESYSDQQSSVADMQQTYADLQQSYADHPQYVADSQLSFADQQPYTDQQQYNTNLQESYADEQQSNDQPQHFADDQEQSLDEYNSESYPNNQEDVAYIANDVYRETPFVQEPEAPMNQEYDTPMVQNHEPPGVQQLEPEQDFSLEEGFQIDGAEIYGAELPENPAAAQFIDTQPITPISSVEPKEKVAEKS